MNKIICERHPASQLPQDQRPSSDPNAQVTVTVEVEESRPTQVPTLDEIWAMRRPPFRTKEKIDADLRRLRDEWDD